MDIASCTIVNADGPSVVLGTPYAFDGDGNFSGFTLSPIDFKPASTTTLSVKLQRFNGATMASGLKDGRKITITGQMVAATPDAYHQLRRTLLKACDSSLNGGLTALQFQPISTLPAMQFLGVVSDVDPGVAEGSQSTYTIEFDTGQAYPTSQTSSLVTSATNANSTVTVLGDDIVYPVVTLTVNAAVTALNVVITGAITTTIHLVGLSLSAGTHTVVITSTPNGHGITIDGVGNGGLKTLASQWLAMFTGANVVSVGNTGGAISAYSVSWVEAWKL